MIIPLLLVCVGTWALYKKVDVFSAMTEGAKDGLRVTGSILPALCVLLPVVYMFRASGLPEAIAEVCVPVFELLGIPAETAALMLLRPVSGSGGLALGTEIMESFGPDSYIGRVAAVMLGSTETTFYVIAVYFGAAGIKKTRHALPSALMADLAGFIMAAVSVRLFF